ncbi:MAG: glycosyltransferase involved in cell wall biosynthesis [Saprospiraceae bacterium]|jgi:glycosyltransferase involved in cell wall biosynthesis
MRLLTPQPSSIRNLHILIIPSWYPANPTDLNGCFFREQSLSLKKHGHEVGVIDVKLRLPRSWRLLFNGFFGSVTEVDEGLLTYRFCGFDWFRRSPRLRRWLWLRYGMKVVEQYLAEQGKPDVIHAHATFHGGELAKSVSQKFAIPFVIAEHSSAFARGQVSKQKIEIARDVATSAIRRFAVSGKFCNLLELLFDDALPWEEMPNMVEQRFIDSELSEQDWTIEPFIFLTVALLTENKSVHNLVSAFARAFGDNPNVILRIGGDGKELTRLEKLAFELNVTDRVVFLGKLSRNQVCEEMSNSSVFVLPSSYETFGVVVIEALALGRPVIATRCGGPESIVRKQDGLLVPINDVPALAAAMVKMRSGNFVYDAEEIRAACIERFSGSTIAKRLTNVYSEVIAVNSGTVD